MANKSGNLIVNYLPQNMSDRELYSMFVTIGPIDSCKVMKDYKTGYSYGFGFVNFSRAEDAGKAIQTLNGQEIYNKRIKVSYARPSGEDIKDTNLYVTNLPRHYTEVDLEHLFSPYGAIVQKNLLLDKLTKLPRGVAFVRFNRREEAQEAIGNLDGHIPEGGSDRLSVRVAEEHGKQKAAYYAGWQAGIQQSRGGREGLRGANHAARGGRNTDTGYNNHLLSYPVRTNNNSFGALRQEKMQQRYNPLSFGMGNNRYLAF